MTRYASALFLSPPPSGAFVSQLLPGAHVILFPRGSPHASVRVRAWGLELRDTLLVLSPGPSFEPAFLFRVPLSEGTMAENVLKHGTGALHIDASRVFTDWEEADRPESWKKSGHTSKPEAGKIAAPPGTGITLHAQGRFPPNVVFVHSPSCVREGVKDVVSDGRHPARRGAAGLWSGEGGGMNGTSSPERFFGDNGRETVAAWSCVKGCPAGMLDEQVGHLRGSGKSGVRKGPRSTTTYRTQTEGDGSSWEAHDSGGNASRFYPQFVGEVELYLWLEHLITPIGGECLHESV